MKQNYRLPYYNTFLRWIAGLVAIGYLFFCQPLYGYDFFDYLKDVHQKAIAKEIYNNETWLYLLHYYPVAPDSQSDITDRRFFLSEKGNVDPQAELYETLEAIFDPVFEKGDRHGQCLFRSRFIWLDRQLNFDRRYLPEVRCKNYQVWRDLVSAQSISLVFASSFMDNPGSVYGHTFLKINREKGGTRLNLLDHVIQYQALPEDNIGIVYVMKGIFGGYKGLYPLDPYYIPIQNNIEFEDRSIWEYELNLTDQQMEILLTHSWELAHFYTQYYFFKENCAYRIVELIEIAAPQYRFKDKFLFWAMPSQSVVYALNEKGLIRQVNYFPSRTRQLMQKFGNLRPEEKRLLGSLVADPGLMNSDAFQNLSEERKIRILDTVLDYSRSRVNKDRDKPRTADHRRKFLLARSRLGKSRGYEAHVSDEQSIHQGHAPARFQIATGNRNDLPFLQMAIRTSYQDLLADETGHLKNSHFTTLDFYFRIYEEDWTLHKLDIVYLFDLAPNNIISDDWSWRFRAGVYPSTISSCLHCRKSQLQTAFGKSLSMFSNSTVGYLLAHGSFEADRHYEDDYLLGTGVDMGVLVDINQTWRLQMELTGSQGIAGDDHAYVKGFVQQRWRLSQQSDVRLQWNYQTEHEVLLALNGYF